MTEPYIEVAKMVTLKPVHPVYRYTISLVDDILDELYYTGDVRNGSFWEFFHTEEDRLLSVKVEYIRYVEKVKVEVLVKSPPTDAPDRCGDDL